MKKPFLKHSPLNFIHDGQFWCTEDWNWKILQFVAEDMSTYHPTIHTKELLDIHLQIICWNFRKIQESRRWVRVPWLPRKGEPLNFIRKDKSEGWGKAVLSLTPKERFCKGRLFLFPPPWSSVTSITKGLHYHLLDEDKLALKQTYKARTEWFIKLKKI